MPSERGRRHAFSHDGITQTAVPLPNLSAIPDTKRNTTIIHAQHIDSTSRFAPILTAHRSGPFLAGDTLTALTLHAEGDLAVAWAPFDYVERNARLVVVGITPGRHQAEVALHSFRDALATGHSGAEALQRAKATASFSGPMRANLIALLDAIGAARVLGVASCVEVFEPGRGLAHLTSALRHPVFVAGANYNGAPDMLRTPVLRQIVETHLAEEARVLPHALWLPLGPKPAAALRHLVARGDLDPSRILDGLPHPSGANAERIAYFLGRKARSALSAKTRADDLDAARERLVCQIAQLVA